MERDLLAQMTMDALGAALEGHADRTTDTLYSIGMQADYHEMYGVCCAFATAGAQALKKIYDTGYDPATGDLLFLQEIEPGAAEADPPKTWALRFLVAHSNGDTPMSLALFDTALQASDEEYVRSVAALLASVGGLMRLALDKP